MKVNKESMVLYAITDRAWLKGKTLCSQVEEALKGGATFLQLREKHLDQAQFLEEAKELQVLCRQYGVPLIINDSVEVALAMNADGIHVGQRDMEAGDVRRLLGEDKILGVSAATVEQAVLAEQRGADYLGVGAVFPTGTKDDARVLDHKVLKAICEAVSIPVVAIGGITEDNLTELAGSGIDGIAVISAIFAKEDVRGAAERLKEKTLAMLKA